MLAILFAIFALTFAQEASSTTERKPERKPEIAQDRFEMDNLKKNLTGDESQFIKLGYTNNSGILDFFSKT